MIQSRETLTTQLFQSTPLSSECFLAFLSSGQLDLLRRPSAMPQHASATTEVEERCQAAARLLVCLDYDGTLVPIAARPEQARPPSPVLRILSQLAQTPDIDVAIMSGRPLANLRTILPIPGVAYIGTHGLEVCTARGEFLSFLPPGAFSTILTSLRMQIEHLVADVPGIFVENKGQAFALHYRLAQPEIAEQLVAESLAMIRRYQGKGVALEVQHGKKVLEIHPVGVNKGKAVQFLLQSYDNTILPLYIGDDVTDENAFRVLNKRGVTILVADPPRRTSARYHLRNPEEVWCFLTRLLEARTLGRSVS